MGSSNSHSLQWDFRVMFGRILQAVARHLNVPPAPICDAGALGSPTHRSSLTYPELLTDKSWLLIYCGN